MLRRLGAIGYVAEPGCNVWDEGASVGAGKIVKGRYKLRIVTPVLDCSFRQ